MVLVRPHRVVVGLDPEGRARHAIDAARCLQGPFDLGVRYVAALHIPFVFRDDPDERLRAVHKSAIADTRKDILELYGERLPPDAELEVLVGDKARVMTQLARQSDVDMLILGPHRARPVIDRGSVARAVLATSNCAVWVQQGPPQDITSILVPTDLSEEGQAALHVAIELAYGLGARVHVLFCFEPPDIVRAVRAGLEEDGGAPIIERLHRRERRAFDEMLHSVNWQGVQFLAEFVDGRPAQHILERQGQNQLIVMGTHGRRGLSRMLLGSVTDSVVRRAEIPVLAIPIVERDWQLQEGDHVLADEPAPA